MKYFKRKQLRSLGAAFLCIFQQWYAKMEEDQNSICYSDSNVGGNWSSVIFKGQNQFATPRGFPDKPAASKSESEAMLCCLMLRRTQKLQGMKPRGSCRGKINNPNPHYLWETVVLLIWEDTLFSSTREVWFNLTKASVMYVAENLGAGDHYHPRSI